MRGAANGSATARRWGSVLVAGVLVVLAGACGGGGGDGAGSPSRGADPGATDGGPTDGERDGGPVSSGGERPTLSWSPVEGATEYSVVVADGQGVPYWGWQGEETEVTVGEGAPTPVVDAEMTWTVVAYDAQGAVVWESGERPV